MGPIVDSFFPSAGNRDAVTEEDDLQKQFPDILQVREIVGIYEVRVKDVEVPLKVKVIRVGAQYYGIASLAVREKGAKDHFRDLSGYPSKEAALHGAVNGFFSHLSPPGHRLKRSRTGAYNKHPRSSFFKNAAVRDWFTELQSFR